MSLLEKRITYKPFLYNQAYDFWLKQQQSHWIPTEVQMASDVQDWKLNLTQSEKSVIAGVLKGFIQAELVVEDYWASRVAQWFQHPEIQMMASTFGAFESIHTVAYAYLNDTLDLTDYNSFLQEPAAKAKIDRLINIEPNTKDLKQIATSLAIFSAFTEGVSLFSSFAILFNFSRFNKLKGVSQIISWSVLDESLHSQAGTWLFRTLIQENPEIWTDDVKQKIYEAARETIKLEDNFIDMVFKDGEIEGVNTHDLKQFIRHRANVKLGEVLCKTNWKNIDQDSLKRMAWFDTLSQGIAQQDFFSGREFSYGKGVVDFGKIFQDD